MDSLIQLEVPLSDLPCDRCREELSDSRNEADLNFYRMDVSVPRAEELEPVTVPLDVRKITWQRQERGRYAADALISVPCPCCQNPRELRYRLEAPLILLTDIGKCRSCGGDLTLDEEQLEYTDSGDGSWEIRVRGNLICDRCISRQFKEVRVPAPAFPTLKERGDVEISLAHSRPIADPRAATVGGQAHVPGGEIFISYRRADSQDVTGRIYDRVVTRFGSERVIRDVDSIPYGVNFKDHVRDALRQCRVLLVVIGREWLEIRDVHGNRRLDDPEDYVRVEVETAIDRGIPVIPLFVGGASMPAKSHLPESMEPLTYQNGLPVRPDPDFDVDLARLIRALERYMHTG